MDRVGLEEKGMLIQMLCVCFMVLNGFNYRTDICCRTHFCADGWERYRVHTGCIIILLFNKIINMIICFFLRNATHCNLKRFISCILYHTIALMELCNAKCVI